MAFPSLSRRPISVDVTYEDNAISSPMEAGYVHRRPRYTRKRRMWEVKYDLLGAADKAALVSHFETVGTHTSFTWTDQDNNSFTVYFKEPIKFKRELPGWWNFDTLVFLEV